MRIAVNAINLSSAGGLTVALNFIKCFKQKNLPNTSIVVFAPENKGYEEYSEDNIEVITVPSSWNSKVRRLYVDYFWLPNAIKKCKVDAIFTMGNFAVPSNLPQGLLFMWPYAIYPQEHSVWDLMVPKDRFLRKLRLHAFIRRLRYADIVFPQTETSKSRLQKYYGHILKDILVVPMAYSTLGAHGKVSKKHFHHNTTSKYLLCLTRYYEHKNVEILLEVAKIIKSRNLPYKIVSTVGADQHVKAEIFIRNISSMNLSDIIINIGKVPITDVPHLYEMTDGCLLPTLLESFSATYVDSMNFGKPIFTSKRDFAEDACRNSAYYFNPFDAEEIVSVIHDAYRNKTEMINKINQGKARIKSLPNWEKVSDTYLEQITHLVNKKNDNY